MMKFSRSLLLLALALASDRSGAFAPAGVGGGMARRRSPPAFFRTETMPRMSASAASTSTPTEEKRRKTKKDERMRIFKTDTFYRKGFKEVREEVEKDMEEQFKSPLVDQLKENDNVIQRDGVTVYLAKDFGFCWGVERSIALAYEAVRHFPDRTVHLTNELIHNPEVNEKLEDMDVKFVEKLEDGGKRFEAVGDGDVVILPAFGASLEEMELLDDRGVEMVDTTCPWVSKVWNTVDTHQRKGLTSIIHGKYAHEETVATMSFCEDFICVKDYKEAQMVADYILNGGDKEEFLEYFKNAVSEGFDPDTMLGKLGLANQTTMYKKETRAIGQLIQKSMMAKYGPIESQKRYLEFDTICDATQERQDAVSEMVENAQDLKLDFILVVGGFDSSNTAHLLEIPHKADIQSFHIDRAECIHADNTITHRTVDGEIVTEPFVPNIDADEVRMGVTSGASTPDAAVQECLSSIFLLKKVHDEKRGQRKDGE